MLTAGVLLIAHQHLVASFHIKTIGYVAVGLSGVAQHGNFVALAPHEGGQRVTKFIPCGVAPDGIIFRVLLVHFLGGVVAVEYGAQHRRRTGADSTVIQVDLVAGNKKLFAQF